MKANIGKAQFSIQHFYTEFAGMQLPVEVSCDHYSLLSYSQKLLLHW